MKTRVDAEIEAGQLWRARERLSGVVNQAPYNAQLYEELGYVLLLMRDLPEAGKYLFLSGARKPEYEEAIVLFLYRHGRRDWKRLTTQLPKRARTLRVDEFPLTVQEHLKLLKMPLEYGERPPQVSKRTTLRDFLSATLFFLFVLLLIYIFCTGLTVVLN